MNFSSKFSVSFQKEQQLWERMKTLGILESDLKETFVTSRGPGGQHVNKVASCVILRHIPTGIAVRCEHSRSQALNRFLARRALAEKLASQILGLKTASEMQQEKIRKQKQRRKRRHHQRKSAQS